MDPLVITAVIGALIAASAIAGVLIRRSAGRVRAGGQQVDTALTAPGADITLVQLSSPVCSACAAMRRIGGQLAADDGRIAHREIDVTEHPQLVRELGVLSTPTTLVVDRDGRIRSRIIGAAAAATVRDTVQDALGTAAGARA